jgi:hypothetical protein
MTASLMNLPTKHSFRHICTKGQSINSTNARPNLLIIVAAYRARQKMVLQPGKANNQPVESLSGLLPNILVPSPFVAPQMLDLGA